MTGFIGGEEEAFENQPMAWQTATVYFAVIELVAAVGLWLATPWGAVVWLTTVVSMAVIELMFPGIYGGSLMVVGVRSRDARRPIWRWHGWPRASGRRRSKSLTSSSRSALLIARLEGWMRVHALRPSFDHGANAPELRMNPSFSCEISCKIFGEFPDSNFSGHPKRCGHTCYANSFQF